MAGRDATRILISQKDGKIFDPSELLLWDDLEELDEEEKKSLGHWNSFYYGKYPIIGKIIPIG